MIYYYLFNIFVVYIIKKKERKKRVKVRIKIVVNQKVRGKYTEMRDVFYNDLREK